MAGGTVTIRRAANFRPTSWTPSPNIKTMPKDLLSNVWWSRSDTSRKDDLVRSWFQIWPWPIFGEGGDKISKNIWVGYRPAKYFFEIFSPLSLNMGHIWNHDFARLFVLLKIDCPVGRGLKTKSWNIKIRIAELGVFMHKFAIENDPKP